MAENDVIEFKNLRQRSNVVGQDYENVKVKIKPFAASNATGVLREIKDLEEVKELAISAAIETERVMG